MVANKRGSALSRIFSLGALSSVAGVLAVALLAPFVAVGSTAANTGVQLFENLPAYIKPIDVSESSTIYALRNGEPEEIAIFYHENRVVVPFEEISPYIVDAVIATEDPRYYEHGGVDMLALARATLTNLASFGEGPGASTVTMQFVRNTLVEIAYLSNDPEAISAATEVTVERKLREIRLALALEQEYSKKDILAGYLNMAFFGNQINGVEAASQYYFGRPAKNLNIVQAAYLAGMLAEPNSYKPDTPENLERGITRRNYVLQRMADNGYISQEEADLYKDYPVMQNIKEVKVGCEINQESAFFCDYAVWTIRNSPEFGETPEDREMLLRRGGLEIYTTLDLDLQKVAFDTVHERLPADNEYGFGTASVSVEVGSGRVITMAQNRYFDQAENPAVGRTSVNYNTDKEFGGSSGFQPGSTYKIFTLAEWLKQGFTLGEHVDGSLDEPYLNESGDLVEPKTRKFDVAKDFYAGCGGVGGTWEMGNSGDKTVDDISVLTAVSTSQNTAFAAMAQQLDLCEIRDTAIDFGVHRADGEELQYFPASIIGTNEIAPLSMAAAFAAVANNGVYCSPIALDRVVERRTGRELDTPESICSQAVSPEIAAAMSYALTRVMTGGTGSAANPYDGVPVAGKTGTTDDRIHTWMVGYTSKVATATWVGNVQGQVRQGGLSIGGTAVTVIRHAIWKRIMTAINEKYGGEAFASAESRFLDSPGATVPDIIGLDPLLALAQLKIAGLSGRIMLDPVGSAAPIGSVGMTTPMPGESVPRGSLIDIFISGGGVQLIPTVRGMNMVEAQALLESLGFAVSAPQPSQDWLYEECDPSLPEDVAWGTSPGEGEEADSASAIILIPNRCEGND